MFNKMIPEKIKSELTRLVDVFTKKDYDVRICENGWGFTAYPIAGEDGYNVSDTAYNFDVDEDEDGYWYILEQHKGMLPGCFWTDNREIFWWR